MQLVSQEIRTRLIYMYRDLESRVAALEQTLSRYDHDKPNIKAEADTLAQLAGITAKLKAYERIVGPSPEISEDAHELINELKKKEEQLEQLRLLETEWKAVCVFRLCFPLSPVAVISLADSMVRRCHSQNEASLFSELEKLSTLWESLDRQLKSKVFELANLEERLAKSSHDVGFPSVL